jgi:hypothetical protein
MKKLIGLIFLSLFFSSGVKAALVDSYNLKCNHIYEPEWEITVIIDLKNKKVIKSDSRVEEFSIRDTEDLRLDGDFITDVLAVKHSQRMDNRSGKNHFGAIVTLNMLIFEQLSMPVSYMSMISTYSMGIIVDKKENKLTFIPDDKIIDDINKKSNSRYQAQRLNSSSSIFKCREI